MKDKKEAKTVIKADIDLNVFEDLLAFNQLSTDLLREVLKFAEQQL